MSHRVSTLVDDSVSALTGRLTELEHTVQSRITTPVTEDSITNLEAWTAIEQALMSEFGKLKRDYVNSSTITRSPKKTAAWTAKFHSTCGEISTSAEQESHSSG